MDTLLALLLTYKYAILLPVAFLEGPFLCILLGFLIAGGHLSFLPSFGIMMLVDIVRDMTLYFIGKFWHPAFAGSRLGHRLEAMEHLWHRHTVKAMVLSKWAYGLSLPLIMTSGLARLPVRKFFAVALAITAFQYAVLITAGYYFGKFYQIIGHYLILAQLFAAGGAVFFFLLLALAARAAKKAIPQS